MRILRSLFVTIFILMAASIAWSADASINALQTDVEATKSKAEENTNKINSLAGGLPALETRVSVLENGAIIWSGYCSTSTLETPGKKIYCTDSVDFNTATDYLDVDQFGVFNVLVSGLYRINARAPGNTTYGVRSYVDVNGVTVYRDMANGNGVNSVTATVDFIWPLYSGDNFSVFFENYQNWPRHSSIQVTYVGPMN